MKTEKYICVKNCTKEELKTILNDWIILNVNGLKSKMIFEIAEINPTVFVLAVDRSIDDTDFFYNVYSKQSFRRQSGLLIRQIGQVIYVNIACYFCFNIRIYF